MPVPLDQFVKNLEDSGVISPSKLQDFLPPRAAPKDAQELAKELVRNKKLTRYQAQEIYLGRLFQEFLMIRQHFGRLVPLCVVLAGAASSQDCRAVAAPIDVGTRLELLVDDHLIESMSGLAFVLHAPNKREVALTHDAPWEGNNCGYHTIFQDGELLRMYYMISHSDCGEAEQRKEPATHQVLNGYAESKDGIHWEKPHLGQFDFAGSRHNNVILLDGCDQETEAVLVPFKDLNPDCPPESRYKALVHMGSGLVPHQSADGIRWTRMADEPVLVQGTFDSQNLAFWDPTRAEYRAYFRDFRNGRRDIRTATSRDFIHWTEAAWLEYPGAPPEQLYTNQIAPYYRAPQLLLGFPTRYVDRGWTASLDALPELEHRRQRAKTELRHGTAITDGLFMSSRDAVRFKRWGEAFLRPGAQELGHWIYGDQYQAWGIVETKSEIAGAPNELSIYAVEGCWRGTSDRLRRYTLRIDGFVSLNAPLSGGEFVSQPLVFSGNHLTVNYSTSAAGSIRVELQSPDGKPLAGYGLADCPEIFGDSLERTIAWQSGRDLSALAGQPVRLRVVLKDGDLYALQFK